MAAAAGQEAPDEDILEGKRLLSEYDPAPYTTHSDLTGDGWWWKV